MLPGRTNLHRSGLQFSPRSAGAARGAHHPHRARPRLLPCTTTSTTPHHHSGCCEPHWRTSCIALRGSWRAAAIASRSPPPPSSSCTPRARPSLGWACGAWRPSYGHTHAAVARAPTRGAAPCGCWLHETGSLGRFSSRPVSRALARASVLGGFIGESERGARAICKAAAWVLRDAYGRVCETLPGRS